MAAIIRVELESHMFNRSAGSERMAVVRLRAAHRDLFSLPVESLFGTERLVCVVEPGGARMGLAGDDNSLQCFFIRTSLFLGVGRRGSPEKRVFSSET